MSKLRLRGSTSGYTELQASAVAGDNTITLPATTGGSLIAADSSGNVNIDSGTLYVDATNNRVGVGTSSPTLQFEISNGTNTGYLHPGIGTGLSVGTKNSSSLTLDTNNTSRVTITSGGLVGIGTTSPNEALTVATSSSASYIQICDSSTGTTSGDGLFIGSFNGAAEIKTKENNVLQFGTNNTERARIDSSGRLLVGTSTAGGTELIQVQGTSGGSNLPGGIALRRSSIGNSDDIGYVNFTNASGNVHAGIKAFADGTPGSGDYPGGLMFSTTADGAPSPTTAAIFYANKTAEFYNDVRPSQDNVFQLGQSGRRWSVVYAGTGSINTSDEKLKQNIEALSEAELTVAQQIKLLIKKYRFKDAVEKKGEDARIHVGVIAQEVEQAFTDAGLDARRYGLFCEDELEDGTKRLAIRYDELLAFVLAAL